MFEPPCPWLANGVILPSWGHRNGQSNRLQQNPLWKSLIASVDSSGPGQGLPPLSICVPLPESVLYPLSSCPHTHTHSKSGQKSEGEIGPRSSDQATMPSGVKNSFILIPLCTILRIFCSDKTIQSLKRSLRAPESHFLLSLTHPLLVLFSSLSYLLPPFQCI